MDDEILKYNPAFGIGRNLRKAAKAQVTGFKAVALTPKEAELFLPAAEGTCPEYYPLFVAALRAGVRRGELVALQWGDLQFGAQRMIAIAYSPFNTTTSTGRTRARRARSRDGWIWGRACGVYCWRTGKQRC